MALILRSSIPNLHKMEIRLPQLAEGADSGTVVNLLVSVGDKIEKDQTILELENQKAVAPIPSPASGKVEQIHVKEGDAVAVGQPLIVLAEVGRDLGSSEGRAAPAASTVRSIPKPTTPSGAVPGSRQVPSPSGASPPAAPSIRKMAEELGLNLTQIPGSGRGGRITREDVQGYLAALQSTSGGQKPAAAAPQIDFSKWGKVTRKPLSPLRQTVARVMTESWNSIPHVTQFGQADVTDLLALKQRYDSDYRQRQAPLTMTSFILKAVIRPLRKFPLFNASLDEAAKELVLKEYLHIGIAVDTPEGLLVPVLRDADRQSTEELSRQLSALAERARARKLNLDEMRGASFTISNQGGIGGTHFTPIIPWPQVAILGVGRAAAQPAPRGNTVESRTMLPLALSYDHRVVDGADAARFITELINTLEQFPEEEVRP